LLDFLTSPIVKIELLERMTITRSISATTQAIHIAVIIRTD